MAKHIPDAVTDLIPIKIATGTIVTVCSDQPTSRTEAITTYKLADVTVTAGDGNGDFTIEDGTVNGRKVTVAEQADVPVDTSGTATHVAICDGSVLLLVTTCTSQAVTSGNTVTIPTFSHTVADVS
jgi:hypothetical protein